MGNGYVGSNGGPYAAGKIYCGYCGEFRRYEAKDRYQSVIETANGAFRCGFCGYLIRKQGRHWTRAIGKDPKRY